MVRQGWKPLNENHTMVIIASAFDASSQRIVRYLSEEHEIAINTAFFTVFEDDGQTLLTTDWLLDQSEVAERSFSSFSAHAASAKVLPLGAAFEFPVARFHQVQS
jgi:hypothetical protein